MEQLVLIPILCCFSWNNINIVAASSVRLCLCHSQHKIKLKIFPRRCHSPLIFIQCLRRYFKMFQPVKMKATFNRKERYTYTQQRKKKKDIFAENIMSMNQQAPFTLVFMHHLTPRNEKTWIAMNWSKQCCRKYRKFSFLFIIKDYFFRNLFFCENRGRNFWSVNISSPVDIAVLHTK